MISPGAYRTRPIAVKAIQWTPALGAVMGVQARPKKHPANPDEWFVKDRFGKEVLIQSGQWIVQTADRGVSVIEDGAFGALYEPVKLQASPVTTTGFNGTPPTLAPPPIPRRLEKAPT